MWNTCSSLERAVTSILRARDVIEDDVIEEGVGEEVDGVELRAESQLAEVVDVRAEQRADVITREVGNELAEVREAVAAGVLPVVVNLQAASTRMSTVHVVVHVYTLPAVSPFRGAT